MVEMATNCCGFFSLAQGVMIVAGLDLVRRRARSHLCVRALPAGRADERAAGRAQVQGMLTVFLGLCVLTAPEQFKGHPLAHHFLYNETTVLAVIVMSIIGAVTVHFSMCAIKGVRQLDAKLLWFFFLWKAGRWGNSACGHAGVPARRRAGARASRPACMHSMQYRLSVVSFAVRATPCAERFSFRFSFSAMSSRPSAQVCNNTSHKCTQIHTHLSRKQMHTPTHAD